MLRPSWFPYALLCVVAAFPQLSSAAEETKQEAIAPQSLGDALEEWAVRNGKQLLYDNDLTVGLRTPGVPAGLSNMEVLARLLAGTGLDYRVLNERTISILPRSAAAGKTGRAGGSDASTVQLAEQDGSKSPASPAPGAGKEASESTAGNSQQSGAEFQEIIVTATKRAESVQSVPLSIGVVSGDDLGRRGVVDVQDYLRGMPGVNQNDSTRGPAIVIRGLEITIGNQNFTTGPMTATYFGETPTTSSASVAGGSSIDIKAVDVERVEVLRGPQGTAFGNASMGGAVRTIPVAPKLDRFEGRALAGFSATSGTGGNNYTVQAVGNIPLIRDKLAIRAVGYQYEDSGFYRNRAASDAAFQAAIAPYGAQAFAIDQEEVGAYHVRGGRLAALFQATENLRFTVSYLSQKTETDGLALESSGLYEKSTLQVAPEHVVRGETGGVHDTHIDIANAVMEYGFSWANLLATYSYSKSGAIVALPTFFNALPLSQKVDGDHREQVGEIRLVSQLEGRFNFLAGLYAEEVKDTSLWTNFWFGDPATNIYRAGLHDMGTRDDGPRVVKQKAAFGEASWEILQGLTLSAGARVFQYDRIFPVVGSGFFYTGLTIDEESDDSGESLKANLSYRPNQNSMFYAGWSQGYRLSQLYAGLPSSVCDLDGDGLLDGTSTTIASTRKSNSDSIDNYELGAKLALLDRRLTINADVFRADWTGLPVTAIPSSTVAACNNSYRYTINGGAARSEGLEVEVNWQMVDAVRLSLGASHVDARLTRDVPAQGYRSGDQLPGSPKFNANLGVQYDFEIGGYGASLRADSIYVGTFYGALGQANAATSKGGDYVRIDTTARLNIRNLNFDVFVRNLTDEDAYAYRALGLGGGIYGYRLRPRTFGMQLSYDFR